MDFRPMATAEREKLIGALRRNAEWEDPILMDRRDTSFVGVAEDSADEEVICAIQSIPCHY
jgi:hypothetical protein